MHAVIQFPDISNEIFSVTLFGRDFALRWYALAYLGGLIAGWRVIAGLMADGVTEIYNPAFIA